MRILFYLPVVTPWWFENIVVHLIRAAATEAEVHVLAPPPWRNTGIGSDQLALCGGLGNVEWHIVDGGDHPSLRTAPADPDGVVAFVDGLAPDHILCRSADAATPARFRGRVRYLMEGGSPPLATPAELVLLQDDVLHHGEMPDLSPEDRARIDRDFATDWKRLRNRFDTRQAFRLPREKALARLGVPADRKVIALPLEYAHEENFFTVHHRFERNLDLVAHVAERLGEEFVLAITDHPLNYRFCDNSEVHAFIRALGHRAHLVPDIGAPGEATSLLVKHCDGLIVQNSKVVLVGAYFGKPTLRLSDCATGDWIRVHADIDAFVAQVRAGTAAAADEADARTWLGFHVMHEAIDPARISGRELVERLEQPYSAARLAAGLERFRAQRAAG